MFPISFMPPENHLYLPHKHSGELNETLKGQDLFVVSQASEGISVRKLR